MAGKADPGRHSNRLCHFCLYVQLQKGLGGGLLRLQGRGSLGAHHGPPCGGRVEATEHPPPASCLPTKGCSVACSLEDHTHARHFLGQSCGKGDTALLAHQETPIRHPEQVQAGGWVGRDGRIWLGPRWAGEVVSSQLFSPQVRRILIPWTERQTDRQTPTPPSALLSRLPRGFLPKSLWRSCKEVWPQAPGPGEGEAWALPLHPYRSLYLQGHPNTDTYKYTPSMHTCP